MGFNSGFKGLTFIELLRMSDGGGVRKGRAVTQLSIVIRQVLTRVI